MTKDLEDTLRELGCEYCSVIDRLRMAYAQDPVCGDVCADSALPCHRAAPRWRISLLWAASVAALLLGAVAVFCGRSESEKVYAVRAADAAHEYCLAIVRDDKAVQEMIRTQRPDGGWANDFLTRQNAAALRLCPDEKAQIAYRRAMRNLRLRHH